MNAQGKRACAFLDRDGVLNVDTGYPFRVEDLIFIDGACEAVAHLNRCGYLVIVVTNQGGVGKGLFEPADVDRFHAAMSERLAIAGGRIDRFYASFHHPDAIHPRWRHPDHPDRKPNPGMLHAAMADLPIRSEGSFLIGDRSTDIMAAEAAGVTGHLFPGGRLDVFVRGILAELGDSS